MSGPVRVLAIGGLDPSGRAGLLADVETIVHLGARAAAIATCLTVQGGGEFSSQPVSPALLARQVAAVRATGPVHAVKLGVVPTAQAFEVLRRALQGLRAPVVIDPVTRTSKGEPLSGVPPLAFARWARQGAVLTPNLDELGWLGTVPLYAGLIVKSFEPATDLVLRPGAPALRLRGPVLRRSPLHHRGTGCRFASAVAVALARGASLPQAAAQGRRVVRKFLRMPILAHS